MATKYFRFRSPRLWAYAMGPYRGDNIAVGQVTSNAGFIIAAII
jgi:hypothetical protein